MMTLCDKCKREFDTCEYEEEETEVKDVEIICPDCKNDCEA